MSPLKGIRVIEFCQIAVSPFAGMLLTPRQVIRFLILLFCCPAFACNYPDEGNMPLRRAVSKVKYLPQTEAWAGAMHKAGEVVQYALLLDQPTHKGGVCYWPIEARAEGKVWRRFYVTPDGKRLLQPDAGKNK